MTLFHRWRSFFCCLLIIAFVGCLAPEAQAAQIVISGRDANGNWRPASLREAAPALLNFLKPYAAPALGILGGGALLALGLNPVTALLTALGVGVTSYFGMGALSRLLTPSKGSTPAGSSPANAQAPAGSSGDGVVSTSGPRPQTVSAPGRVDLIGVSTPGR